MGQPVLDRYMESEIRPKAFEELGRQIQVYMKFIEAYKAKVTDTEQQRTFFSGIIVSYQNIEMIPVFPPPGWAVQSPRWAGCDTGGEAGEWCHVLDEQQDEPAE